MRGVAVFLVIGHHLRLPEPSGPLKVFSHLWFQIGWLGVELFFVLSGFLIGGLLLEELRLRGTLNVRRFLLRRALKIYPSYLLLIIYLLLVPIAKASFGGGDPFRAFADRLSLFWPNFFFLQNYVGTNPAGHTWTLAVEEHFYIALPVLLASLAIFRRLQWALVLMLAAIPACLALRCLSVLVDDSFVPGMNRTHLRLDALFFGVAIRTFAYHWPASFLKVRRWRGCLVLAGCALWLPAAFLSAQAVAIHTLGLTGILLGSGAFLVAAYHTCAADFGRLMRPARQVASGIAWIGGYSYTIYLWHVSVIGITEGRRGAQIMELAGEWAGAVWLGATLVVCVLAVVVGVVASKAVEWPILRLRDRLLPSPATAVPPAGASLSYPPINFL